MSKIEVNKIIPRTGTTLSLGDSGDTLTLTSGAKTSGFGKIGQVVHAETNTVNTVTGITFADSGLSASITPSSTSSKIYISISQLVLVERPSSTYAFGGLRLLRGSTSIYSPNPEDGSGTFGIGVQLSSTNLANFRTFFPLVYLDSPSTTSQVTYKTQMRAYTSTGKIKAQTAGSNQNGRSSIILMEVLD
ncbi:hypothetical protein Lederberg_1 [Pelagibacter phage Lederberg EXVC029P]|nr:hypothetical protein Lederberg_1 [Pelagibacter phage Lederberg EXVC029P]